MPKSSSKPMKPIELKPTSEVGSKTTYTNKGMAQDKGPQTPKVDKEHQKLRDEWAAKSKTKEELVGGKGDNRPDSDFDQEQLRIGTKIEFEHTHDKDKAKEIAKDHLTESPDYYRELKVMEEKLEKPIKKSFQRIDDLSKALKAAAAASLSRRAQADAQGAPRSSNEQAVEVQDIGVGYTRPLYEPPAVPVRRVQTPNPLPAKPCSDHVFKTQPVGPSESKPFRER